MAHIHEYVSLQKSGVLRLPGNVREKLRLDVPGAQVEIEKQRRNVGVGEMGGDAGTHGPGSEDGDTTDWFQHTIVQSGDRRETAVTP